MKNNVDYATGAILDEIDIKTESLKHDLDNLRDELRSEFLKAANDIKK